MDYATAKQILKVNTDLSSVAPEAALDLLRKAYYKEIRKYHSDVNKEISKDVSQKKSSEVNNAYEYLKSYYQSKTANAEQFKQSSSQYEDENDDYEEPKTTGQKSQSNQKESTNNNSNNNSNKSSNNKSTNENKDTKSESKKTSSSSNQSNTNSGNSSKSSSTSHNRPYEDHSNSSYSNQSYNSGKYYQKSSYKDNVFKRMGSRIAEFFEDIGDIFSDVKDWFGDLKDDVAYFLEEHWLKITLSIALLGGGGYYVYHNYIDGNRSVELNGVEFDNNDANEEMKKAINNIFWELHVIQKIIISDSQKEDAKVLIEEMNSVINEYLGSKSITVEYETDPELVSAYNQTYNQSLNSQVNEGARTVYIVEKDFYTKQELNEIFKTIFQAHAEEYYKDQIGMMKIGSLADNLMAASYNSPDNNYIVNLAKMATINFSSHLPDYNVDQEIRQLYFDILNETAQQSYENYTADINQLIDIYYKKVLQDLDIKVTVSEMNSSLFYNQLQSLDQIYHKEISDLYRVYIIPNQYIRYSDIINHPFTFDKIRDHEDFMRGSIIDNLRKTLAPYVLAENEEYLSENIPEIIYQLFAQLKYDRAQDYYIVNAYYFIKDYKNFGDDKIYEQYGIKEPLEELYKACGVSNYEEFREKYSQAFEEYDGQETVSSTTSQENVF